MKKSFFYYASVSILAGVCLSLGWYHHYIRHLPSIAPIIMPAFDPEHKAVEVHIRALSSDASKQLLGFNLLSKGVQPLHITIENNSPYEYSICPSSVDLDRIDSNEIASEILKSSIPRSIAFKILGFLFWPFMIPGTIDTIHTLHSYKSLKKDYSAKSIKDEMVPMYSVVNRILFIPMESFKENFTVTLIEKEKQTCEVFAISKEQPSLENAEHVLGEEDIAIV